MDTEIPTTGRIGRFARVLKATVSENDYLEVMRGSESFKEKNLKEKAEWWRKAMQRFDSLSGAETAEDVMRECGRRCCNTGNRKTATRLMAESKNMEDFLEKSSTYGVKAGEIEYFLKDERTVIGRFHRCFCGQVRYFENTFDSLTYCHCSEEFHKQYFEAALGRPVEAEITQSIIHGAEFCEFIIRI